MTASDKALFDNENVTQYLRYHMVPDEKPRRGRKENPTSNRQEPDRQAAPTRRQERKPHPLDDKVNEIGFPWPGMCLIFDWETFSYGAQKPRFAVAQIRGLPPETRRTLAARGRLTRERLDDLRETILVYEPENCTPADVETLQAYAAERGWELITRAEFALGVLIGGGRFWKQYWCPDGKHEERMIIGFNLPFDISRTAFGWRYAIDDFYGGFTFRLCACERPNGQWCSFHPPVKINPIAARKSMFGWAAVSPSRKYRWKSEFRTRRAEFLDVAQFARALLGPRGGGSLHHLCGVLKVEHPKVDFTDYDGPITPGFIDYAERDVRATWECYVKLRDEQYRPQRLRKPMSKIYSEASLGKAYFEELGFPKFMERHGLTGSDKIMKHLKQSGYGIHPAVVGNFMEAYYGGRSEVRMRNAVREIIHCDFKSQYPTVNALMNLQALLLADWIEVRRNNNETRDFLSPSTVARMLARLQKPETWRLLRGIAKVRPSSDVLPVRAAFGSGATTNIAQCRIKSGPDTYYTIADVVASFLLTGKMPEILETITLHPQGRVETRTKALFNDQCYTVDLTKDDLFVRLIDLRSEIKAGAKQAAQEDRAYLEARQEALKLVANSTAYGALVEYRDDERARPRWATVWYGDEDECVRRRAQKLEQPGAWFAGPVGVLIPAAGRLLLAIAERLATDRGIQHVFCDTDSMCFARPGEMDFPTFAAKAHEIVDWFTPLSPYQGKPPIFNIEVGDPGWHCFAVSAKRYAIFRLGDPAKGEPRIMFKKISSHGMGAIRDPKGYRSIFCDVPPREDIGEIVTAKVAACIIYDIWREAIEAVLDGKEPPRDREYLEAYPFYHPERIGNRHEMELYKALNHAWPFSFGSFMPRLVGFADPNRISKQRLNELGGPFFGPHGASFDEIKGSLYNRETGERIELQEAEAAGLRPQSLADVLRGYFDHKEAKAANPDGIGLLERREVVITGRKYMGKETPIIDEDFTQDELNEFYRGRVVIGSREHKPRVKPDPALVERMRRCLPAELARATGFHKDTIIRWRKGECGVALDRMPALLAALDVLENARETEQQQAERLRGRINALARTEEGSGWSRVKRIAIARGMTDNRYKSITLRDHAPTTDEATLLSGIITQCEREDCPVGPVSVAGVVDRVIWPRTAEDRKRARGRAIFTVAAEGATEPVPVAGFLPVVGVGLSVQIGGEWRYHDEHGPQIVAATITAASPVSEIEMKAYLASGVVPSIGKTTAFRLTDRFGADVFKVAADQPERLAEIRGLSKEAAEALGRVAHELCGGKLYDRDDASYPDRPVSDDMKAMLAALPDAGLSNIAAGLRDFLSGFNNAEPPAFDPRGIVSASLLEGVPEFGSEWKDAA